MKKKILFLVAAPILIVLGTIGLSAFEAHVINVTAQVENSLSVPVEELEFGTVFPQEALDKTFDISLSQSFLEESRVDDVEYVVRQKPKCADDVMNPTEFSRVTEDEEGNFVCENEQHVMLPLLCPYLSKEEITEDGSDEENDGEAILAFHGPIVDWDMSETLAHETGGKLIKTAQDISDTWNIDLKVPCFGDHCAQDWEEFVLGINEDTVPEDYIQPVENEHKIFGCDLWIEVGAISLPPTIACAEEADVMLVMDRSGSISDSEEAIMKTAAKAFVDALAPSTDGVHMGQSSFSTTGSLDQELTDSGALVKAAIDALAPGGTTNLQEGIELATAELASVRDRLDTDSPDVMVIITDGLPTASSGPGGHGTDATNAADAAKADGIEIFVVGVGTSTTTAEFLRDNIATDEDHYFDAGDFEDLEEVLAGLLACEEE